MKTSKNENVQNDQTVQIPNKQSKKAKSILASIDKEAVLTSNKPLQAPKKVEPEYTLVGVMNLRRTKHIPNATVQTLVLSSDLHQHLLILGIKSRLTWDELSRNILSDYVSQNPI